MPADVLGSLMADRAAQPELRARLMSALLDPPRAAVEQLLDRAIARGDLREDLDIGLAVDLLGSLVDPRALFGHAPTSDAEIERTVETLLRGIATDYPKLLAHSRRQADASQTHPRRATEIARTSPSTVGR